MNEIYIDGEYNQTGQEKPKEVIGDVRFLPFRNPLQISIFSKLAPKESTIKEIGFEKYVDLITFYSKKIDEYLKNPDNSEQISQCFNCEDKDRARFIEDLALKIIFVLTHDDHIPKAA